MSISRELDAVVLTADGDAEVLAAVAAAVAASERVNVEVPTLAELGAWFVEAMPPALLAEANARLAVVLGRGAEWIVTRTVEVVIGADGVKRSGSGGGGPVLMPFLPGSPGSLSGMHRLWVKMPDRPRHPLGPLVRGWLARAPEVAIETRTDRRVLPAIRFGSAHPDRERGMLLGAGLGEREGAVQRVLPLWPEPARVKRVPLLELVDVLGRARLRAWPGRARCRRGCLCGRWSRCGRRTVRGRSHASRSPCGSFGTGSFRRGGGGTAACGPAGGCPRTGRVCGTRC